MVTNFLPLGVKVRSITTIIEVGDLSRSIFWYEKVTDNLI